GHIAQTDICKAQTLFGGRGKAGLVRRAGVAPKETIGEIAAALSERGLPPVLMIEEATEFETELYLSIVLDDLAACPVLMFSPQGGIDIEQNGNVAIHPLAPDGAVCAHDLVTFFAQAGAPRAA